MKTIRRIKENTTSTVPKLEESELGELTFRDQCDKKRFGDYNEEDPRNNTFEHEDTNYHERIEMKAMTKGINLTVNSCASKRYKLQLSKSKQGGIRSQIGVFNRGKILQKGTLFGPIEEKRSPEEWCRKLDQLGYDRSYRELEEGHNWLYFIRIARQATSTNMDVIFKNENDCYYVTRKDIPKGHELLSDLGWTGLED